MRTEEDILRFISDQMDPSERISFQADLDDDSELRKSVEHSRRIKKNIDQKTISFSRDVRNVIEANRKSQKKPFFLIAASFSLLVSASVLYYFLSSSNETESLTFAYLQPFPDVVTNRSKEGSSINLLSYNIGNYTSAIDELSAQFELAHDPLTGLYLGTSYLLSDQAEKAMEIFERIEGKEAQLTEDIQWYKSLAMIKLNQIKKAKESLKSLIESQSSYSEKASQLLEDLD